MTSMFMRVNSKGAHQVRPPLGPDTEERGRWVTLRDYSLELVNSVHVIEAANKPPAAGELAHG